MTSQNAHEEIQRLVARHTVLREACFQAWWGFTVLRGQRPESHDWTEAQRKAMRELDRLIKVTHAAKERPEDIECPDCKRDRELVDGVRYCEPCATTPKSEYS